MVLLRRRRVRGSSPTVARRASSIWRCAKASRTRSLRTTTAQASRREMAQSPMIRHQPLVTSVLAESLRVAKERSTAVRRA